MVCRIAGRHHFLNLAAQFQPLAELPSQYCALASSVDKVTAEITLQTRGITIPLQIQQIASTTKYLCLAMFNLSDWRDQAIWLYVNVNISPKKDTLSYKAGQNYTDYGNDALPILTEFQDRFGITPGYVGPINLAAVYNHQMANMHNYQIRVFELNSVIDKSKYSQAMKKCGPARARLQFRSKWGTVAAVLLVTFFM